MRWFPGWIKKKEHREEGPSIRFGRQMSLFMPEERAALWEDALTAFEQGQHLDGVIAFLGFLNDGSDNVHWSQEGEHIRFSIRQGSKQVFGQAGPEKLRIEAPVARVTRNSIGLWRKLLELNYQLNYSRYALDEDQTVCLRFDAFAIDSSPFKLYAAIKEVALNADKEDDLMIEDFEGLVAVHNEHVLQLPELEKTVKLSFLRKGIRDCIELIKDPSLNASLHTGGLAYIILDGIYRMDYLTRPEGKTMVAFEEIQKSFFSGAAQSTGEKIREAVATLQELEDRQDDDFLRELYYVPRTFSVLQEVSSDVIRGLWIAESNHIDWYLENKQFRIARAIVGYALGYALFNYALSPLHVELIHELYRFQEREYFGSLGFHDRYDNALDNVREKAFKEAVSHILRQYGQDTALADLLDHANEATLARSFLNLIIQVE